MDKYKKYFFPESEFGGFSNIDGTLLFYSRINALLTKTMKVLDVGCGRGRKGKDYISKLRNLKGKAKQIIGMDIDPACFNNPNLDKFILLKGKKWPIKSGTINLCISDFVLEHVQDPEFYFKEARRVLKKGGIFCFRTPNIWSYFGLASKIVPEFLKKKMLSKVQPSRGEEEIYPTNYRANSYFKLKKLLKLNGFDYALFGYEAEPNYLTFNFFLFCLGNFLRKITPHVFKNAFFCFARKK